MDPTLGKSAMMPRLGRQPAHPRLTRTWTWTRSWSWSWSWTRPAEAGRSRSQIGGPGRFNVVLRTALAMLRCRRTQITQPVYPAATDDSIGQGLYDRAGSQDAIGRTGCAGGVPGRREHKHHWLVRGRRGREGHHESQWTWWE